MSSAPDVADGFQGLSHREENDRVAERAERERSEVALALGGHLLLDDVEDDAARQEREEDGERLAAQGNDEPGGYPDEDGEGQHPPAVVVVRLAVVMPEGPVVDQEVEAHRDSEQEQAREPRFLAVQQEVSHQEVVEPERDDVHPEHALAPLLLARSVRIPARLGALARGSALGGPLDAVVREKPSERDQVDVALQKPDPERFLTDVARYAADFGQYVDKHVRHRDAP